VNLVFCPLGTFENSPAAYCWGACREITAVRLGTVERSRRQPREVKPSVVPDATPEFKKLQYPATMVLDLIVFHRPLKKKQLRCTIAPKR
jgi:hypothetical protein